MRSAPFCNKHVADERGAVVFILYIFVLRRKSYGRCITKFSGNKRVDSRESIAVQRDDSRDGEAISGIE
jgi:hypothetical protein